MCTSYHITLFFLTFVKKELARSSVKNKSRRLVKIKIDVRKMGKEWRNFKNIGLQVDFKVAEFDLK